MTSTTFALPDDDDDLQPEWDGYDVDHDNDQMLDLLEQVLEIANFQFANFGSDSAHRVMAALEPLLEGWP